MQVLNVEPEVCGSSVLSMRDQGDQTEYLVGEGSFNIAVI